MRRNNRELSAAETELVDMMLGDVGVESRGPPLVRFFLPFLPRFCV